MCSLARPTANLSLSPTLHCVAAAVAVLFMHVFPVDATLLGLLQHNGWQKPKIRLFFWPLEQFFFFCVFWLFCPFEITGY